MWRPHEKEKQGDVSVDALRLYHCIVASRLSIPVKYSGANHATAKGNASDRNLDLAKINPCYIVRDGTTILQNERLLGGFWMRS